MRRKSIPIEFLELINADTARAVTKALERNRLTHKWLLYRLDQDWGIQVKKAYLSQVLSGKREMSFSTRRLLWCSQQIVAEYESFYKERRKRQ